MEHQENTKQQQPAKGKTPPTRAKTAIPASLVLGWASYALMVVINVSFEAFSFGGVTSSEVSGQVFAWFTPAGYAFSIWALIYVVLAVWMYAVTRSIVSFGKNEDFSIAVFICTNILNVAWLTLFHLQMIEASAAVILMLLAAVGVLYRTEHRKEMNLYRYAPVSIYFGWITVASIANLAHLVARYESFSYPVNEVSTALIAIGVMLIGYALSRVEKDLVYPLVLIWALVAVGVHLLAASPATSAVVFAITAVGAVLIYGHASGNPAGRIRSTLAGS